MPEMPYNLDGFQQPIIFVFGFLKVVWFCGEGRTMPVLGCKKTLGVSFFATKRHGFISLSANSLDCLCRIPHVGSSASRLINLTSASIVVCILGANTSSYRRLPSSLSNPCNLERFAILSYIVCGIKECKVRPCQVTSMARMEPGLGAVW